MYKFIVLKKFTELDTKINFLISDHLDWIKRKITYYIVLSFHYRFMNVKLNDAVYCDPQGNEYKLEQLYVKSRNIRYVHIPESVSTLCPN